MKILVDKVSWSIRAKKIIEYINLNVASGEFVGLIGPNGSGKSTLLRLIYRIFPPDYGVIRIEEKDIWLLHAKEMACNTAVVTQERILDFDFTVQQVVMMGRNPHKRLLEPDTPQDKIIINESLEQVNMLTFIHRNFRTLSGGEKQRVLIARALAQKAKIIILDEPTNHLDVRYQFEILDLIKSLKITVITALHDLNLAAMYCDRIYLIDQGRIIIDGQPQIVLTPSMIQQIYGVDVEVEVRQSTGKLNIILNGLSS